MLRKIPKKLQLKIARNDTRVSRKCSLFRNIIGCTASAAILAGVAAYLGRKIFQNSCRINGCCGSNATMACCPIFKMSVNSSYGELKIRFCQRNSQLIDLFLLYMLVVAILRGHSYYSIMPNIVRNQDFIWEWLVNSLNKLREMFTIPVNRLLLILRLLLP